MDYYFLGAAAGGVLTDYYFWAAGRTRAPAPEGTANQPCGIYRAPPQHSAAAPRQPGNLADGAAAGDRGQYVQ